MIVKFNTTAFLNIPRIKIEHKVKQN